MTPQPKILAFAGSARSGSFNKKLIKLATNIAQQAGARVTLIDLRDFPMPLYEGDLEAQQGIPAAAIQIREMMLQHQGLLIASPEYNSSIPPLLKNTLDWVSRPYNGHEGLLPYQDKIATLLSASPGNLGGLRGLVHLRAMLENIGVWVLPHQHAIIKAHEAFEENGNLKDARQAQILEKTCRKLVDTLHKLTNAH